MRRGWLGGCAATLVWAASAWPASAWAAPPVCPHETPKSGEWRVVRGFGVGPTKGAAIQAAEQNARADLRQQLEGAFDEIGLEGLLSSLNFTMYPPEHDPSSGEACVLGLAEDVKLGETVRRHVSALDQQLVTLAAAVQGKLKRADRLRVEVPLWPGVWTKAEPARDLRNHLLGRLVGVEVSDHRPTRVLAGEVTAAGDTCRWVPLLEDSRTKGRVSLGEVRFHPLALGQKRCEAPAVAGGGELPRPRVGVGGLRVTLTTTLPTTIPCGGAPFQVEVQTNQPAWVRLYSVTSQGEVMLVMPDREVNGSEPVTTPANPARYIHLGAGIRSGLFAVAVPKSQAFPTLGVDQPGCLGHQGLQWHTLPSTASVYGAAVQVKPPLSPGCSVQPDDQRANNQTLAAIAELPRCEH